MNKKAEHKLGQSVVDVRCLRSVCILGEGVTGKAVERYFSTLPQLPKISFFGDDTQVQGSFDLAVVSPGIPPHNILVQSARSCAGELISEPELAFRVSPQRWIVVTGTNGKSTTTALCAHVLNACGIKARVAGNIGPTCIEAVCQRSSDEYIVAELSSYQLAYSQTILPQAAVLLNITPDHLTWHGSYEAYRDAKLSLFERLSDEAVAVVDATLEETRSVVRARRDAGGRVIPLGTTEGLSGDMTVRCGAAEAAFVDPETFMLTCVIDRQRIPVIGASDLCILGEHNQENALAAAAVALALGADPHKVADGLASFQPLEHRIEPCGEVDGVCFFNDSKATNPQATLKALDAFAGRPLIVLLGGRDKNTSLDELVELAGSACKYAVCYGEAGPRFAATFAAFAGAGQKTHAESLLVEDLEAALAAALALAVPGDTILLSPACASFDEFESFEHRGQVFKERVSALQHSSQHPDDTTGGARVVR